MRILVINCGSSSIKHKTFDMNDGSVLASGILERIGETGGRILYQWRNSAGGLEKVEKEAQSSV
ncbi:MAG: acetate kinase, partial [Deltaproteobacteria bacterium]|nr:acetate kinase [Deltaproteobacteria bacterium]